LLSLRTKLIIKPILTGDNEYRRKSNEKDKALQQHAKINQMFKSFFLSTPNINTHYHAIQKLKRINANAMQNLTAVLGYLPKACQIQEKLRKQIINNALKLKLTRRNP
jgi:CRISPR/Cas system CSM-associated protein Csm2 small subunit